MENMDEKRPSVNKIEPVDYSSPFGFLPKIPFFTLLISSRFSIITIAISLLLGIFLQGTWSTILFAACCYIAIFSSIVRRIAKRNARSRNAHLAELNADTLPERANRAARTLQDAITLVAELQDELTARAALLEDVKRQVAETTERAADMEKLSHVDEETSRILNKYFDEALKNRLDGLERGARSREWVIGTVVALLVGVGVILISHYTLGF